MKTLFDHQIFSLQKYGGISRYFCELMTRFSNDPAIDYSVALRFSTNEHLLGLPQLDSHWSRRSSLNSHTHVCSLAKKAAQYESLRYLLTNALLFINQRESERLLKKQDFDLFHPTYYDPYFLRHLRKKPYVITVYDMIHEIFPDNFPAQDPIRTWKKKVLEHADGIITISESTKTDIARFLPIDPDRIHVIYLGNPSGDPTNTGQCSIPAGHREIKKPYILFVGNRTGYKNFVFFIRAAAATLYKDNELQVCCAGGGPFTPGEKELLNNLRILNRVQYVQPDDRGMRRLYSDARVFVFPSKYEGFGLPVLEAFSCGCPVILSNTSSLPEVGGDAAVYFDPDDMSSLTDALERLLFDNTLRTQLIIKGHERRQQFTWERTARSTRNLYENLVTG